MAGAAVLRIAGRSTVVHGPVGRGTNNEAEYQGAIAGLQAAKFAGATTVTLRGDSQLVLRQLEGRYQVKAPNLQPLHAEARALIRAFTKVSFEWVKRADNAEADAAANAALDA